jgi:Family of unknown function (DUF6459)
MAEPNSPQTPAPTGTSRLTGQLVPLPAARPHRPLPDAVAIHQIAVPQADPPYDPADDLAADSAVTLDLLEPALPARVEAPATAGPESATWPAVPAPDLTHFAERYSAGPWPSQFAQALAETLAGTRPRSQLAPWTSIKTRRRISQLSPLMATSSQPKLKRVIISSPAGGVLEMTVVVDLGQRVRALAVRLELTDPPAPPSSPSPDQAAPARPADPARLAAPTDPRWHCTAIEAA